MNVLEEKTKGKKEKIIQNEFSELDNTNIDESI